MPKLKKKSAEMKLAAKKLKGKISRTNKKKLKMKKLLLKNKYEENSEKFRNVDLMAGTILYTANVYWKLDVMDPNKKIERKENPKEKANLFSLITFFYSLDIIKRAYKKDLTENDLYEVVSPYRSAKIGGKLESEWKKLLKRNQPSLYKLLWRCYGKDYLILGMIQLLMKVAYILLFPTALAELVKYFGKDQQEVTREDAIWSGGVVIGLSLLYCIYNHNYTFNVVQMGIKARTAFCSLIYRKSIKLSPAALEEYNTGRIVTLITKDCFTIENVFELFNDIWVSIVLTFAGGYQIYLKVGWIPTLIGVGFYFICIPIQLLLSKIMTGVRINSSRRTDERLHLTQEILAAIKIIKMYTWEMFFLKKISNLRIKEVSKIRMVFFIKVTAVCIGIIASQVALFLLIISYMRLGNTINAALVFYIIGIFHTAMSSAAINVPLGFVQCADLHATFRRMQNFLLAEEISPSLHHRDIAIEPIIDIKSVTVIIEDKIILHITNLTFAKGLTILTGPLGGGKSTLLKALISEYKFTGGKLLVRGRISYASEDSWLFPATIKQNILFGEPYEERRYQEVLNACELTYDLARFAKGDQTLIGDKGVNLSKGQQARISLARAVYKISDIYLLDDCLSSLDAHVQHSVFMKCVKQFLGDKLCILVSHNDDFIKLATNVVVIEKGFVKSVLNSSDILENRISKYMDEENIEKTITIDDLDSLEIADELISDENADVKMKEKSPLLIEIPEENSTNMYHEESKTGNVPCSVYVAYIRYAGGFIMSFLLLIGFVTFQGIASINYKLLSSWVDIEAKLYEVKHNASENSTSSYEIVYESRNAVLKYYTITIVGTTVSIFIVSFWSFYMTARASAKIHKQMLRNLLNATMDFFDKFLTGNIMNRFSKDIGIIDEYIPYLVYELIRLGCTLIGILLITIIINKIFIIPATILLGVMYVMRNFYMPSGRSLKRLDAATKSPVVGHLSASIEGIATIRASGKQRIVCEEFDRHQDLYTSAYHTSIITVRAFGFALDLFCTLFIATVVTTFLTLDKGASAGNVGLAITQVIGLRNFLQFAIKTSTELQNNMVSLERVLEFISSEQESTKGIEVKNWPNSSAIKYEDVSLKYRKTGELILKHIDFSVKSGQRIGIVGRTGAGKSSIVATLFRLYAIDGKVIIDSQDTAQLPLKMLRSNISIIPQDPILFTGTIRSNIDPADEFDDKAIWDVLNQVGLAVTITNLETPVSKRGTGYSSGQKQLLCLARALILDNRIVILDEATANMDSETADLIHEVIRTKLANHTVLIIAHRLNTVLDTDKVMVVHRGQIVEFDSTKRLLENVDSKFRKMVQKAGLL